MPGPGAQVTSAIRGTATHSSYEQLIDGQANSSASRSTGPAAQPYPPASHTASALPALPRAPAPLGRPPLYVSPPPSAGTRTAPAGPARPPRAVVPPPVPQEPGRYPQGDGGP